MQTVTIKLGASGVWGARWEVREGSKTGPILGHVEAKNPGRFQALDIHGRVIAQPGTDRCVFETKASAAWLVHQDVLAWRARARAFRPGDLSARITWPVESR